jgi:hypothetical protein
MRRRLTTPESQLHYRKVFTLQEARSIRLPNIDRPIPERSTGQLLHHPFF